MGKLKVLETSLPARDYVEAKGMSFSSRELEFSSQDPTRSGSRGSCMPLWPLRVLTRIDIDIKLNLNKTHVSQILA